jgi:hypothetical protein
MRRIVSKNGRAITAQVTADLSIHLEDPVFTNPIRHKLLKPNSHCSVMLRSIRDYYGHKTWISDNWKCVTW